MQGTKEWEERGSELIVQWQSHLGWKFFPAKQIWYQNVG